MDRKIEMVNKEFRNVVARFVAATVAAGSIFGGVALGLAAGAHASPTAQAQQEHAMHTNTDPAARRQEGPRVPPRETAPQQRRVAVPGEAPQHHASKRRSGEM